jgi:ribosomal protein S18 acetylase RimI-like enzyme
MLTDEPATREQRVQFLEMLRMELAGYLDRTLQHLEMTWGQFVESFQSRGEIHAVREDGEVAGYYWIEMRGETLHLHGIVILPEFRGRGIGTHLLRKLDREYSSRVTAIELGVKDDNARARRLYDQAGFRAVRSLPDIGFTIMQKEFPPTSPEPDETPFSIRSRL